MLANHTMTSRRKEHVLVAPTLHADRKIEFSIHRVLPRMVEDLKRVFPGVAGLEEVRSPSLAFLCSCARTSCTLVSTEQRLGRGQTPGHNLWSAVIIPCRPRQRARPLTGLLLALLRGACAVPAHLATSRPRSVRYHPTTGDCRAHIPGVQVRPHRQRSRTRRREGQASGELYRVGDRSVHYTTRHGALGGE